MFKNITKEKRETYFFLAIMLTSMIVRLFFIYYTSVYDMQHDAGTPNENYGHLGYISYFMNNWKLPDFDVREAFQFWHPPIHHLISAVFLTLIWLIFPGQNGNYEALQILPFIYITLCIWILWKTLKLWDLEEKSLFSPMLLIAFIPTFITLSGSVNNDALCTMLTFLALYLTLAWYKTPTYRLIIASALSIGLAMSVKGSAAIAAFPMALLFLIKLLKEKKKVIGQLFVFGVLSLPLGLWWYIRNYVLFGVPINYIYYMSTEATGYIGHVSLYQRLHGCNLKYFSFANMYLQFEGNFTDVNPIVGLLKTAVYGQWRFNYNPYIKVIAYPLLFIWTALTIISLFAIPSFLKKNKERLIESVSILVLFVAQFTSYYKFCLDFPFVWTMDFRYAIPLLLCHCLFLAEFVRQKGVWAKRFVQCLCIGFSSITVICFVLLAFTTFRV